MNLRFGALVRALALAALALPLCAQNPVSPGGSSANNLSLPAVTPEFYGAQGNANIFYDGAIGNSSEIVSNFSTGSTTATAPAVTTTSNNAVVVSIFDTNASWSSAPATGTQRSNQAFASSEYGLLARDQTIATPGSVAAVSGTLASSTPWIAATIALAPKSGQTISFVNAAGTQQSTGSTLTIAAPSGIQSGDFLLACIAFYPYTNPPTYFFSSVPSQFGHTGYFQSFDTVGDALLCTGHFATNGEPGSYVWGQNVTSGLTGFILAYRNVQSIDGYSNVLTSSSANFSGSNVGNPICVASQSLSSFVGQSCGTITGYTSSTQVTLSFYAGFASSAVFAFGADDTSAFQSATSSGCAKGCNLGLSNKRYILTGSLSLPKEVSINIIGSGPGAPGTANSILNGINPNLSNGTQLLWLTQSLASPAISISGTVGHTSTTVEDTLEGFTMWGGVGFGRDGGSLGSVDAIDILNWQQANVGKVFVFNFSGNGLYVDALAGTSTLDYSENVQIEKSLFSFNYGAGIKVGGLANVDNLETTTANYTISEMNAGPGILVAGSTVQGFSAHGNTIQWNNHFNNGWSSELEVTGTIQGGCDIAGNYFEADNVGGSNSTSPFNNAAGLLSCTPVLPFNFYLSGNWTPLNFATSQLPGCGSQATDHYTANVSDATACTNGAALAGGASTHCIVSCKPGTGWTETGAGWY